MPFRYASNFGATISFEVCLSLVSNPAFIKSSFHQQQQFIKETEFTQQGNLCFSGRFSCTIFFQSSHAHSVLFFCFSFPAQGEIKIIFQTFTASGTSKLPVRHLFYFYCPFSTFPSLPALSMLCKWKGMEENTQLTSGNGIGGKGSSPPGSAPRGPSPCPEP